MEINRLIRTNISRLQPYSCARDEYSDDNAVFLDANENPFDTGYNRYPDPYQEKLKQVIGKVKNVAVENMVLGNGSDELIDMLIRSVCEPERDNVIVFSPGYAMYEVSAHINDAEVRKLDLTPEFLPDWKEVERRTDEFTKIIFLCTPNNPVGKVIPIVQVESLCQKFGGLVVVDEAYIDFTAAASAVSLLEKYRNVVVLQTLSKSWGMAGLRLGMCFADRDLVKVLNKVKAPYNINSLTQRKATEVLQDYAEFRKKLDRIIEEREILINAFRDLGLFRDVYSSEANFILVTSDASGELYDFLIDNRVVVRLRDIPPLIQGGVRITVGTPDENRRLLKLLREFRILLLNRRVK